MSRVRRHYWRYFQEEVGDSGEMEQSIVELFSDKPNRETMVCPNCGRMLNRRDVHERTVETMIGEIKLRRHYFYCTNCKDIVGNLCEEVNVLDIAQRGKYRKKWGEWAKEESIEQFAILAWSGQERGSAWKRQTMWGSAPRPRKPCKGLMLALRCAKHNGTFQRL